MIVISRDTLHTRHTLLYISVINVMMIIITAPNSFHIRSNKLSMHTLVNSRQIMIQKHNLRCTYLLIMLYWKLVHCRYVPLHYL